MGFTASGRQVRSRHGGPYVESLLSRPDSAAGNGEAAAIDVDDEDEEPVNRGRGRPRRSVQPNGIRKHVREKSMREFDGSEASNDDSEDTPSSNEWNGEDEKEVDEKDDDDDDDLEMSEDEDEVVDEDKEDEDAQLVVRLKYSKGQSKSPQSTTQVNGIVSAHKADEQNLNLSALGSDPKGNVFRDRPELQEQLKPLGSHSGLRNEVSISKGVDEESLTADQDDVDSRPSSSPVPQPPTAFQPQTFLYQDKQI